MIDDFGSPVRRKPKVIAPIVSPERTPLPVLPETPAPPVHALSSEEASPDVDHELTSFTTASSLGATRHRFRGFRFKRPLSKKQKIIGSVLAVLLAFSIGAAWTYFHHTKPVIAATIHTTAPKKVVVAPQPILSTLTGLPVADASANQRPVTGVMIENSPDARPQSGLDQAGIVFEAIAEGGITRFLTLFQDSQPDYLGPVRSARPYYVQWCMGFDCSLAHVGGSPEALQDIQDWNTKNLDEFAAAGSFERISSRYAPHNVYTSIAQLNQLESSRGYGASSFIGFPRKADAPYKAPTPAAAGSSASKTTAPQDGRTPATTIDMNISGYYYNTHYDYDAATNSYKRSEGGAPHMSLHKDGTQVQIQPKVVIAMVMQYGLEADDHHSQYNVIGSGQAFVFQDGTVTTGSWSKTDRSAPLTFADSNGKAISLDAGQTWLTALGAANQVTYK